MSTPIRNAFPLLVLFIAFDTCLFIACQKEEESNAPTIFNVRVVDSKSGKSVVGSFAVFNTVATNEPNASTLKTETVFADNYGRFTISIPGERSMSSFTLAATGYLTRIRFVQAKEHQSNDLEIPLIPTDAVLKLTIENKTGFTDQFYWAATSPIALKELGRNYALSSFKIPLGAHFFYIKPFPSGEKATLYFGTKNFINPINFSLADKVDSVFLKPNDTTLYKISY